MQRYTCVIYSRKPHTHLRIGLQYNLRNIDERCLELLFLYKNPLVHPPENATCASDSDSEMCTFCLNIKCALFV